MDGLGWDGISPDRSISRSPSGDNNASEKFKLGTTSKKKQIILNGQDSPQRVLQNQAQIDFDNENDDFYDENSRNDWRNSRGTL